MASKEASNPAALLRVSESSPLQKDRCIVCQKKKSTKLTSTDGGQKRLREAAALRKDDVLNRLKLIPETEKFYYHMDNGCYKSYTLKTLDRIRSATDDGDNSEEEESGTSDPNSPFTKRARRSSSTARPSASDARLSNQELPCIVCGSITTTAQK